MISDHRHRRSTCRSSTGHSTRDVHGGAGCPRFPALAHIISVVRRRIDKVLIGKKHTRPSRALGQVPRPDSALVVSLQLDTLLFMIL
jgi:hypothetical protein